MKIGCRTLAACLFLPLGWETMKLSRLSSPPSPMPTRSPKPLPLSTQDGTRELLRWGGSMLGAGVLAALLLVTLLGGFTHTGAGTNTGWLALIVALMCIPFGGLLLGLGVAKWLRNRRLEKIR
jgi:hypothetical protein